MEFYLSQVTEEDMPVFKKDMQEAFQQGAISEFGDIDVEILPEKDIDDSLSKKGAIAYKAVADGKIVGGAIVVIDNVSRHNHLDFLYVKVGTQSKGMGRQIWKEVEKMHPRNKSLGNLHSLLREKEHSLLRQLLGFSYRGIFQSLPYRPEYSR